MTVWDLPVLHGYVWGDMERMSRQAAGTAHGSFGYTLAERRELAWSAIAEHMVVSVEAPTVGELIGIGKRAIYRGVRSAMHHHGVERRDMLRGLWSMRAFAVYWWWVTRRYAGDPGERVTERVALVQIWGRMKEEDRRVLAALAVFETYQAAADGLGMKYERYKERIARARRRFRREWYWPEVDPGPWGCDRRVSVGGKRAETHWSVGERRRARERRTVG